MSKYLRYYKCRIAPFAKPVQAVIEWAQVIEINDMKQLDFGRRVNGVDIKDPKFYSPAHGRELHPIWHLEGWYTSVDFAVQKAKRDLQNDIQHIQDQLNNSTHHLSLINALPVN